MSFYFYVKLFDRLPFKDLNLTSIKNSCIIVIYNNFCLLSLNFKNIKTFICYLLMDVFYAYMQTVDR